MMRKHKTILLLAGIWLLNIAPLMAQPRARAAREEAKKTGPELTVRAQNRYPRSRTLPEDVIWTREIYRTLDLSKDANGALYYPVEPVGDRKNLLTLIFDLLAEKKIPAYEYLPDGTERLTAEYEMNFRDVLDRFNIYYEEQPAPGRRDSIIILQNSDVPSTEVLSYFIKEVWYFDQRTSTYGSAITSICPVMHRAEDFSSVPLKLPMFWIDYSDLAPYLTRSSIMTSDLNNSANRNMDDFFVSRLYQGDIYKTTNMMNRTLAQYCETDSAMAKEQKRIEAELALFEQHLYGKEEKVETDSVSTAKEKDTRVSKKERTRTASKEPKASSSDRSSAPKASVRRQRR